MPPNLMGPEHSQSLVCSAVVVRVHTSSFALMSGALRRDPVTFLNLRCPLFPCQAQDQDTIAPSNQTKRQIQARLCPCQDMKAGVAPDQHKSLGDHCAITISYQEQMALRIIRSTL